VTQDRWPGTGETGVVSSHNPRGRGFKSRPPGRVSRRRKVPSRRARFWYVEALRPPRPPGRWTEAPAGVRRRCSPTPTTWAFCPSKIHPPPDSTRDLPPKTLTALDADQPPRSTSDPLPSALNHQESGDDRFNLPRRSPGRPLRLGTAHEGGAPANNSP